MSVPYDMVKHRTNLFPIPTTKKELSNDKIFFSDTIGLAPSTGAYATAIFKPRRKGAFVMLECSISDGTAPITTGAEQGMMAYQNAYIRVLKNGISYFESFTDVAGASNDSLPLSNCRRENPYMFFGEFNLGDSISVFCYDVGAWKDMIMFGLTGYYY